MNRRNAFFFAGLAAIAVAGCSKPAETSASSGSVITVNGEAISNEEFFNYLASESTVQISTSQGPQQARTLGPIGLQAVRDLVTRKLLTQLATEAKVLPTKEDVAAEVDLQLSKNTALADQIAKNPSGRSALETDVFLSLVRERLITKGVTVTAAEVDAYVKQNPAQFTDPPKIKAKFIVIKDATMRPEIDAALGKGQSFEAVAAKYSLDPNVKANGAAFPEEDVTKLPPDFQTAIGATAVGKPTTWLQNGEQWIKLYILSKTPAKKQVIDEKRKLEIQRGLKVMKGQQTTNLNAMVTDKLQTAKVEVGPESLRRPWDVAFEEAKISMAKQQVTQGTPAAGEVPKTQPAPKKP